MFGYMRRRCNQIQSYNAASLRSLRARYRIIIVGNELVSSLRSLIRELWSVALLEIGESPKGYTGNK